MTIIVKPPAALHNMVILTQILVKIVCIIVEFVKDYHRIGRSVLVVEPIINILIQSSYLMALITLHAFLSVLMESISPFSTILATTVHHHAPLVMEEQILLVRLAFLENS